MLSTSFAFRKYVADGRHLANKVELTYADGTTKTLYGEDLAMGGVSFSTASSSMGSFDIGSAIIGTASLSLANHDERWNDFDFTGATCVVSLGAALDGGSVEWLRKGTYGVVQPELYDSTIELECMDNMRLFQIPYSDVPTTYPATLQTIVADVCSFCGVTMLSAGFPHDSQVVPARPGDDNLSCLDVLSWAAQMAGCFCDVDTWGRLRIRWYDTSAYETEDWLDGGSYLTETTPYSDGDAADGGGFHTDVDDADGGDFTQAPWAVVSAIKSLSTATDDVVITGVRVTASDQVKADGTQGSKGESYLYGTEGYVLSVEANALVTYGNAQSVATAIGPAIVGMRFRPLTVTAIGDPAIEAGDPMLVIDWRQRTFRSWVTSNTWKQGSYQSLACSAETPARNSADSHSAITRAIVEQRNAMRVETSVRELAVSQLARELSEASGLYKTEQEQPDHSVIYYLHDKPTLAESQIVWKMTSAAFAVSVDGGVTYPFGFDAWGNAILNAIYTIGLNADYMNTGALRIGPAQSPLVVADFDAGTFFLSGAASMGNRTVQQVLDGVDATITNVDVEYAQNQSASTAPSSGWSTTAPAWASGYYIWQRAATTTGTGASAVTTYSTPVMISGRDGTDGQTGPAGADGIGITSIVEQYYLSTSNQTQTGGSWSSTQPTWTSGTYIWTRSEITWDTTPATTTHTTPVLATALTQANSEAKAASNAVTALDNGLNQAEVFNRLTDNGTIQGLYMQNGQLYMNGSYIHGGTIVAGGANNANGVIQVKNADGAVTCTLDKDGAVIVGDVSMLATCNILAGSGSTYNRQALAKIGVLSFTDSDMFSQLVGTNISSSNYKLPGLRITGGTASADIGYLQLVPPIHGTYARSSIYSTKPIYIVDGEANAKKGAGILVGDSSTRIAGRNSNTRITVYADDTAASEHVDIESPTVNIGSNVSSYTVAIKSKTTISAAVSVTSSLTVSGTKSRQVSTDSYDERLLYCYESAEPLFGDVGSGIIDEHGTCVVAIDDVFGECARTDMAYQVFLQKCGPGDLWVAEKTPTHFVVEGTPGLAFDWEAKAHQAGYEAERLEDVVRRDDAETMGIEDLSPLDAYPQEDTGEQFDPYEDELGYIEEIERLYEEAA